MACVWIECGHTTVLRWRRSEGNSKVAFLVLLSSKSMDRTQVRKFVWQVLSPTERSHQAEKSCLFNNENYGRRPQGKRATTTPISPQMQQLPLPLLLLRGLFWRSNNILEDNCTCTEHSWTFPYVQMHYSVCYNNELLYSCVNYSHRCLHCDRAVYPLALALGMDG